MTLFIPAREAQNMLIPRRGKKARTKNPGAGKKDMKREHGIAEG